MEACPCHHIKPCDPGCTCVHPGSSVGCRRCCTYGSPEQQKAAAERLAFPFQFACDPIKEAVKDVLRVLEDTGSLDPYPKQDVIDYIEHAVLCTRATMINEYSKSMKGDLCPFGCGNAGHNYVCFPIAPKHD